ncbi:MAG: recombinase family protein, partial [Planctomycetes bacterium]|nr:recombinase family protein [Planctomycetota bacterium]
MKKKETTTAPQVRVAVYARASVSRGLEFDSVTAQVEAIDAYIASQRGSGWMRLPTPYVDDGYSGGDIDRPAFA